MPYYETTFWRKTIFRYIVTFGIIFIVLTTSAMFFYPGGSFHDPSDMGYSFFDSPLSTLGRLKSWSGDTNYISASLFTTGLTLAGVSLILFSLAFPQFFPRTDRGFLSVQIGKYLGIATGICFIGTALTPADILKLLHHHISLWGFRFFALAALFWMIAIFRNKKYLNRYAWIFVAFFLLLISFILLGIFGPNPLESKLGNTIIVIAQKIVAYASIVSILLQSLCALSINRNLKYNNIKRNDS